MLTSGPFSIFTGIDRILTVLEGTLALEFDLADETVVLERNSPPHAFSGDRTVYGSPRGTVVDLNVMARRGAFHGVATRYSGMAWGADPCGAQQRLLVSCETAAVFSDATHWSLKPLDALFFSDAAAPITGSGSIVVIDLYAL